MSWDVDDESEDSKGPTPIPSPAIKPTPAGAGVEGAGGGAASTEEGVSGETKAQEAAGEAQGTSPSKWLTQPTCIHAANLSCRYSSCEFKL